MLFAEVFLMRHLGDKSQNGFSVTDTRYKDYFDKLSKQKYYFKAYLGVLHRQSMEILPNPPLLMVENLSKIRG